MPGERTRTRPHRADWCGRAANGGWPAAEVPALKRLRGSWHRWRYPFTRRTPLLFETTYNPVTLAAERRIVDWRPILWLVALLVLAIAPPPFGNNSFILPPPPASRCTRRST